MRSRRSRAPWWLRAGRSGRDRRDGVKREPGLAGRNRTSPNHVIKLQEELIMTARTTIAIIPREPALFGQTVVVIGGSAGIGLETARQARAEGADVILTGRNAERLQSAATELGAESTKAFDAV